MAFDKQEDIVAVVGGGEDKQREKRDESRIKMECDPL
jgi:hypothetical protein